MSHIDLSRFPADSYVSMAEIGDCRVCGHRGDLRCGACFNCAKRVDGRPIPGGHELWSIDNPSIRWKVLVQ